MLVGWVLFRADTLGHALDFYRAMVVPTGGTTPAVSASLDSHALVASEGVPLQTDFRLAAASRQFFLKLSYAFQR